MEPVNVSAVVVRDGAGRVLTVRKRGTSSFMLPGGKPESGEADGAAVIRECREELGLALDESSLHEIGVFEAAAANEPGRRVVATVFEQVERADIQEVSPAAEIAEAAWVGLQDPRVAPLLRDQVFPALQRGHRHIGRVTVFTGSAVGDSPVYAEATAALARTLAASEIGIVYGGGQVGLMGVLADAALEASTEVFGVMPQALVDREIAHSDLTRLDVVADMHARKLRMAELGDAFIALPGGAGTLEELFEAWTWQQLGVHHKPVALYDVDGYWQPLLRALDAMTHHGFLSESLRSSLVVADNPQGLLSALKTWIPQPPKWQAPQSPV